MADLISSSTATTDLASGLPADTSALPAVISAASRAIQRYCGRDFVQATYDECYDSVGYSSILLRQYPVNYVTRVAVAPTVVLTVSNTDATTNQRALARLTTTGDVDAGLTVTGLTLTREASGVVTTDSTVTFAANVTVNAAAAAVTALGNGWSGTATTGYGLWGSANLRAVQGVQNALAGSSGGTGAVFYAHTQDLNNWTLNEQTGEVRLNSTQFDPVFAIMNLAGSPLLATFPPGFQSVRVQYNAGYATVPADVQQACLITVLDWMWRLQRNRALKSETIDKYTYQNWDKVMGGLPDDATALLKAGGWRAYRRY